MNIRDLDLCIICGDLVDLTLDPQSYRENLHQQCVCETCWEKYTDEQLQQFVAYLGEKF